MEAVDRRADGRPRVSVVMANYEAGEKIVPALRSVLEQSMDDLEVIVCDDASGDNSMALVHSMMESDPRIRLSRSNINRGPAHCRNRALSMARGNWIAVVDSDDIIHPERFERLLAAADAQDADIIADDLLLFHEDGTPPRLMLGEEVPASFTVSPERWVMAGMDGSPALGYLKPLIKARHLQDMRYDEGLRIGEDYDFVLRLLLAGAKMIVVPEPFYLYRRHSGSISHRLSVRDMQAMVERQRVLLIEHEPLTPELATAFAARLRVLNQGLAYEQLVAAIKGRQVLDAMVMLSAHPGHLGRLWASFREGRQRRSQPVRTAAKPAGQLVLGGQDVSGHKTLVPDYVSPQQVDWSAPRPRALWRGLAGHAGVHCIALDAAGRYAAGFIPEVRLTARQALREAS